MVFSRISKLRNSYKDGCNSSSNGTSTELEDIEIVLRNHPNIKNHEILDKAFWDMFVIDALIGNYDRHNGNWGILANKKTGEVKFAPIYDCGSCLYSQLTDNQMEDILKDKGQINDRIYNRPTSTIINNGKRINYYEFIKSMKEQELNEAILRVVPKIKKEKIELIIKETPFILAIRKEFYKTMINLRYERILKDTYKKIINKKIRYRKICKNNRSV